MLTILCHSNCLITFRRVPKYISQYDKRKYIKISLKTKDEATARKRAILQNEIIEQFWREIVTELPSSNNYNNLYKKAVQTARLYGFTYRNINDLSKNATLEELVDRLLALKEVSKTDTKNIKPALTGTVEIPKVRLSETWDIYRPRCIDRLIDKTDHQIRKWENPRKLAINNFIEVVGDKYITDINRKDILEYQEWWLTRIKKEGKKPATANKNFNYVRDILENVFIATDIETDIDVTSLFAKIKLKEGIDSRKSYEAEYVQRIFIDSNALNGLNEEARALIYIMADTGARVSEITGLMPEDIRLDTKIPFIYIRKNQRGNLKTAQSERQIPLVGSALYGAKMFPNGLQRYSNADSVSTAINKYLRAHKLNPSEGQSLYSLRHTFKDRLRDVQAPEEVIDNLMGHKSRGPKYGRGHILETKLEWLQRIAFTPPKQ